jgi:hypothetical protein
MMIPEAPTQQLLVEVTITGPAGAPTARQVERQVERDLRAVFTRAPGSFGGRCWVHPDRQAELRAGVERVNLLPLPDGRIRDRWRR